MRLSTAKDLLLLVLLWLIGSNTAQQARAREWSGAGGKKIVKVGYGY